MRIVRVLLSTALLTGVPAVAAAGTASPASSLPTVTGARVVFERMSEAQRIGQLFMVGANATGVDDATRAAISTYHVGNVILTGRSSLGVSSTRSITDGLQGRATVSATQATPLFVATDQEGGEVQVLSGSGFSSIPSGLTQGTWSTDTLRSSAGTWGAQLSRAGVDMDLAPVMDTVPDGADNPPIGGYDREYGHTPSVVASHGSAFAQGLADAGVLATVKHFPGLGRVDRNTDTSSGVTDYTTSSTDSYLTPFSTAIGDGAPLTMISTAYYHRIDPDHPAAFSTAIITALLRDRIGFHGVVISDDLGNAQQVAAWPTGSRATDFIQSGGDIVLTVNPDLIPQMTSAVAARAASDSSFRAKVNAAALRVLLLKQARGLLDRPVAGDFAGSGRSEPAVYRKSNHSWRFLNQADITYGTDAAVPVPADWTGSGRTHIAMYRRVSTGYNSWHVRGSSQVNYGKGADVPVPGDYNGDGVADIAVWRSSTGRWYIRGQDALVLGHHGDIPVPGDYFGLGYDVPAVFDPSSGTWDIAGHASIHLGQHGDVPVPGDYDGDGVVTPTVWRPSNRTWYLANGSAIHYGHTGDVPVRGYDASGNGSTDLVVWRPSSGAWDVRGAAQHHLGIAGDVPV